MPAYQARQGDIFNFITNWIECNNITSKYIVLSPRAEVNVSPLTSLVRMEAIANKFIAWLTRFLGYRPYYVWTIEPTDRGHCHLNLLLIDVQEYIPMALIDSWFVKQDLGESTGVYIEQIEPKDAARGVNYITKYINKVNGAGGHPVWQSLLTLTARRSYGVSQNLRKEVTDWLLYVVVTAQEHAKLKARRSKVKAEAETYNKALHRRAQYYASKGLNNSNKSYITVGISEHSELIDYLKTLRGTGEKPPPEALIMSFYDYLSGPHPARAPSSSFQHQKETEQRLRHQALAERRNASFTDNRPYHVQQAERLFILLEEGSSLSAILSQYPDLDNELVLFQLEKLRGGDKNATK